MQETRRWDDVKGMSISMRSKEDAQDYRYFPEPDLLTIVVPEEKVQAIKESIPELPNAKLMRYVKTLGLNQTDATLIVENLDRAKLMDECIEIGKGTPKSIAKWILADVSKYMNDTGKSIHDTPLTAARLCELVAEVEKGTISNSTGKTVFEAVIAEDKDPSVIIKERGLSQNSDTSALEAIAKEVLAANEKSITDFKNGKTNALGYLVGQCMKASKGKANPGLMKEIVTKLVNEA